MSSQNNKRTENVKIPKIIVSVNLSTTNKAFSAIWKAQQYLAATFDNIQVHLFENPLGKACTEFTEVRYAGWKYVIEAETSTRWDWKRLVGQSQHFPTKLFAAGPGYKIMSRNVFELESVVERDRYTLPLVISACYLIKLTSEVELHLGELRQSVPAYQQQEQKEWQQLKQSIQSMAEHQICHQWQDVNLNVFKTICKILAVDDVTSILEVTGNHYGSIAYDRYHTMRFSRLLLYMNRFCDKQIKSVSLRSLDSHVPFGFQFGCFRQNITLTTVDGDNRVTCLYSPSFLDDVYDEQSTKITNTTSATSTSTSINTAAHALEWERDLLVIDSWSCRAYVKQQLDTFHKTTRAVIVIMGTGTRNGIWNESSVKYNKPKLDELYSTYGFEPLAMLQGVCLAVDQFLIENRGWYRMFDLSGGNSGMVVLVRSNVVLQL